VKIAMIDLEVVTDSTAVLVGKVEPSAGAPIALPPSQRQSRWCLPCFLGGHQ